MMDTGLCLHAGVIRKVCQALWSPQQLFVAECLKYQLARSVMLLAPISFSRPALRMGVLFYAAGNHCASGGFPVCVVIKGGRYKQLLSWSLGCQIIPWKKILEISVPAL